MILRLFFKNGLALVAVAGIFFSCSNILIEFVSSSVTIIGIKEIYIDPRWQ